jgi:hypothetical protein
MDPHKEKIKLNTDILKKNFTKMGADIQVREANRFARTPVTLDVNDKRFLITVAPDVKVDFEVTDLDVKARHLLLLQRDANGDKHKFLCGHDERHWFVAAIPEVARGVTTVKTAMRALQPPEVAGQTDPRTVTKRKTKDYIRQGEWFFVPAPGLKPEKLLILKNEPLSRGRGSKPHNMEFAYRVGGTQVYVSRSHPNGITQAEYTALMASDAMSARKNTWRLMVRDAIVYAMGRITHADHATILLGSWHRVYMNTENKAQAMASVVFLD